MLGMDPCVVERSLEEAQKSLTVNEQLVQTLRDLKASIPDLQFYVMSNISKVRTGRRASFGCPYGPEKGPCGWETKQRL